MLDLTLRQLHVGEIVCIQNLASKPHLNGRHGLVSETKNTTSDQVSESRVVITLLPIACQPEGAAPNLSLRQGCCVPCNDGPILACLAQPGVGSDGFVRFPLGRCSLQLDLLAIFAEYVKIEYQKPPGSRWKLSKCAVCAGQADGAFLECTGCRLVHFCSTRCQQGH